MSKMGLIGMSHFAHWTVAGLTNLESSIVGSPEWDNKTKDEPRFKVSELFKHKSNQLFRTVTSYTFSADSIVIDVEVYPLRGVMSVPSLPRVGLELMVASRLSCLTWLGCGSGESYPDRKSSSDWRVHCADVDKQHVEYIVPGECGGKSDVHWTSLTDPSSPGTGLLIQYASADSPPAKEKVGGVTGNRPASTCGAQISASRWSIEELTSTTHCHKLPSYGDLGALRERPVRFNIDTAHMGVGAAGNGNEAVWAIAPQFLMKADMASPWTYQVKLRPLSGSNEWLHNGVAS
jgi:beta-galactosidase